MTHHSPFRRFGSSLLVLVTLGAAFAAAQPPPPGDPAGPPPAEVRRQPPPLDRESIRNRLLRRLNDTKAMLSRLERALERLDAGAPLAEVMEQRGLDGPPMGRPDGPAAGNRRGGPRLLEPQPEHRPAPAAPQDPAARAARVREFVRRHLPALAEEFERRGTPAAGDRLVAWLAPQLPELESARQRDEDLFQARLDEIRAAIEVGRSLRELRLAAAEPGATPEALRPRLDAIRESLGVQFDARLRVQRREIELLMERVEHLRADTDRREADRERFLDERLAEIEAMIQRRRDEPPPPDRP